MAERIDRAGIVQAPELAQLAQLASLSLTHAEGEKLTLEIGAILAYVSELDALDTSNVPATAHVQLESAAWRADEVQECLPHELALAQAPRTSQEGFAVPGFVESGS